MLIETCTFRLPAGTGEAAFLAADARLQADLSPTRGFLRRTTARGADGAWLVVLLWSSAADADAARAAGLDPVPTAMVDTASVRVDRYTTLD